MQFRILGRVFTIISKKSGKDYKFSFRWTKLEKEVLGINSNCDSKSIYENGMHVVFIDYDNKLTLPELMEECKRLQEQFKDTLGDAYIFESSPKKYHVHFYQQVTYWKAFEIIHFSNCDSQYKKYRGVRFNLTLRISPKGNGFIPKFVMIVPSRYYKEEDLFMKKQMAFLLTYEENLKREVKNGTYCRATSIQNSKN